MRRSMLYQPPTVQVRRTRFPRPGAVALEFALVVSLLFTIFLGMIEISRALMVLGTLSQAARCGARAGSVTSGDYTSIRTAVTTCLEQAHIVVAEEIPVRVLVNGAEITEDETFKALAVPGSTISVQVNIPYRSVSWLPPGTFFFLSSNQILSEAAAMRKEG